MNLKPEEFPEYERLFDRLKGAEGCSWGALVVGPDGVFPVIRIDRPCYGEIRRYEDGTRPEDEHPDDIPDVIPRGPRAAIVMRLPEYCDPKLDQFVEFALGLNPEHPSPWRRGLGPTVDVRYGLNRRYAAFGIPHGRFDPTVLINLMVTLRNVLGRGDGITMSTFLDRGLSFKQAVVGQIFTSKPLGYVTGAVNTGYYLNPFLSLERFFSGDSYDLNDGLTWYEEVDYNRPEMHNIFGGGTGTPGGDISLYGYFCRPADVPVDSYTFEDIINKLKLIID